MIQYILESATIWVILYFFFRLFLEKETHFRINRAYLLIALLAGSVLPLLNIPVTGTGNPGLYTFSMDQVIFTGNGITEDLSAHSGSRVNRLTTALFGIYLAGAIFHLVKLGRNLLFIRSVYQQGHKSRYPEYTLVFIPLTINPFSFLRYMFIPEKLNESMDYSLVQKHELAHIRQGHSLDILFVELLQLLFWFNPILRWYKNTIVQNHEYLADQSSLQHSGKYEYGNLLLSFQKVHPGRFPGSHLTHSIIKNRIAMMYKRRSKPASQFKYLMVLPVLLILAVLFSCEEKETANTVADQQPTELNMDQATPSDQNSVFREVEQMPRFPGCESVEGTEAEKQSCSNDKLMQFIGQNLKYPEAARKNGLEGTVIAEFVVNENGLVQDAKIARDIGDGCGDAVLKVINSMNEMEQKWTPGKQGGEYVKVQFSLPVKFKLDDKEK